MSFNAGEVIVVLGADVDTGAFARYAHAVHKARDAADDAEKRHRKMSMAFGAAGMAAKGAAIGMGTVAAGMAYAIKKAADFESQLSALGAVTKANGATMAEFRAQALKAGADTKFSALEAAKAQTELAKGGLSVAQIMKGGLKGALALAAAGEIDLGVAAETTANALNLFGLNGSQAEHVADALATAANKTTGEVGHFAMALTQGGGAAKAAGLSFDETVAALEALALAGVKGSDAGTSLKAALSQVANPTDESANAMKRLGINFFDAQGSMKPLPAVAEMLRGKLKGLTDQQRIQALQTMAGTDGFRALLALYDQGGPKTEKLINGLKEQGTAADTAAKKQDNLKGRIEQLQGSLETAAIIIGTEMLPVINEFAEDATAKLNEMAASGQLEEIGQSLADGLQVAADALMVLIENAPAIASAFGGAFQLVGGMLDVFLGAITNILDGVEIFANALNKLPGIDIDTSGIDKAGDDIDRLREVLRGDFGATVDIETNASKARDAIQAIDDKKLQKKVVEVLGRDQDAKSKLKALIALGIPEKTARVLAQVGNALTGIRSVAGALGALNDRTVTITTIQRTLTQKINAGTLPKLTQRPKGRATGRGPGGSERAIVGEGSGWQGAREAIVDPVTGRSFTVDGPTLVDLGPHAYVIPEERRFRGGAMDLLAMLADDLGLRGFAPGKKPAKRKKPAAKKHRPVPGPIDPLSLPVDDLKDARGDALKKYKDAQDLVHDLPGDIRTTKASLNDINRRKTSTKAQAQNKAEDRKRAERKLHEQQAKLKKARDQVPRLRAQYRAQDKALRDAQKYQQQIDEQRELANNAATAMELADKRDDETGYNTAKGKRALAVKKLRALIAEAKRHAKPGSAYERKLEGEITQADVDLEDVEAEESPAQTAAREAAERLTDTGMTDEERKTLSDFERDKALATLTETLEDDKRVQGALVGFLEGILGHVGERGVSSSGIADLANRVKQERDNLESFSTGSSVNDDPDLQAKLDQERERNRVLSAESLFNKQALQVFGGAGDLGLGGPIGRGATNFIIQSYVPPTPAEARRLADYTVGGMTYQPAVQSPREKVGI